MLSTQERIEAIREAFGKMPMESIVRGLAAVAPDEFAGYAERLRVANSSTDEEGLVEHDEERDSLRTEIGTAVAKAIGEAFAEFEGPITGLAIACPPAGGTDERSAEEVAEKVAQVEQVAHEKPVMVAVAVAVAQLIPWLLNARDGAAYSHLQQLRNGGNGEVDPAQIMMALAAASTGQGDATAPPSLELISVLIAAFGVGVNLGKALANAEQDHIDGLTGSDAMDNWLADLTKPGEGTDEPC